MGKEQLRQFISQLYPLTPAEMDDFIEGWTPMIVKRKTILTAAGETERYLYFVLEGVQRAFYLGDDNREATIVFTYAPSFSGVADSFLTRTPSVYFLETLTASRFLRISHDEFSRLIQKHEGIKDLMFNSVSWILKGLLERQVELQCFSNEEKFRTLLKRSPHILNLVPHKYIASYLGIDATNFSKLLNTVRI